MRLLTWNIAHGRGLARRQSSLARATIERNLAAIAEVIRREQPDVVALQEVDRHSSWSGGFDHLELLSELSGLPHRLHGAHFAITVGRTHVNCGTALLSALPWVETRAATFASAWRDNKGWVAGRVLCGSADVEVFSVHLDFLNPLVRRRQVHKLLADLSVDQRAVVAGDLNSPSLRRGAMAHLTNGSELVVVGPIDPTFPADAPRWCLDRVLLTPSLSIRSGRVLDERLSDHRPVLVEFAVGSDEP